LHHAGKQAAAARIVAHHPLYTALDVARTAQAPTIIALLESRGAMSGKDL